VSFRAHSPPTRLTNMFGDPINPLPNNLPTISYDNTNPVFNQSCPIPAVSVNSDAGSCSASYASVAPTLATGPGVPSAARVDRGHTKT